VQADITNIMDTMISRFDDIVINLVAMENRLTGRFVNSERPDKINWASLIIPATTTTKMTWVDSWSRCVSLGAQPFVPRTPQDYEIIKTVRAALGGYLWVPASDLIQEGSL
ncbi:unnamed protein product, partial [Meganyctiphanes norvegica]